MRCVVHGGVGESNLVVRTEGLRDSSRSSSYVAPLSNFTKSIIIMQAWPLSDDKLRNVLISV